MKYLPSLLLLTLTLFVASCAQPESSGDAGQDTAEKPATTSAEAAAAGGAYVVYINSDTLLEKYDYFRKEMERLEAQEQQINAQLNQRARALEQEFRSVQQKIQEGLLTPNQIAQQEQRLTQAQQEIMVERESRSQELMAETDKLNKELRKRLDELLTRLQAENGCDFVLQYGQGSNVLMVNPALDVTELVLRELNSRPEPEAATGE